MQNFSFPPEVSEILGCYVYAYVDPRDDEIFYIGKGIGDRAFAHLYDLAETQKTQRIVEIRAANLAPRIDILVYGLSEQEALRVEAVCIDLIGIHKLTNLVSGHRSSWGGRRSADEIITEFAAQPVEIDDRAITININRSYVYGMSEEDLYDATRGVWKIGERRQNASIALAVCRGIVREVYSIEQWYPAGTTQYTRQVFEPEELKNRFEFTGHIAASWLQEKYKGKRVPHTKSAQNPIRYYNC